MHILWRVRSDVVMAVMACPPERAALSTGAAQDRKCKLDRTGRFKGSMREVSVVPTCDGKHPDEIECGRHRDRSPAPAHPDNAQTHAVNGDERNAAEPIHLGNVI